MKRAYEMMVIIDGDVDDPKAQSWMKTITEEITRSAASCTTRSIGGASVSSPTRSTRSRPATTSLLRSLPRLVRSTTSSVTLRLADDIVRHKLIRLPEDEAARRGIAVEAA